MDIKKTKTKNQIQSLCQNIEDLLQVLDEEGTKETTKEEVVKSTLKKELMVTLKKQIEEFE